MTHPPANLTSAAPGSDHFPQRVDFVGLGAPKSGTTWLARRLMDHPQVIMTGERPLFTSGFHLAPINPAHTWAGVAAELGQPKDPARSLLGTYYNEYLYSPYALRFLSQRFPRAKVYVVLRNPLARAISHYLHHLVWTQLLEPHRTFVDALAMDHMGILEYGYYDVYLPRWLESFPREQVGVFIHEDLKADPRGFLSQVAGWLGLGNAVLPPDSADKGRNANAIEAVGVPEAALDFLHDAYGRTIDYVGRLLGRDLSGVWTRRISRVRPGAKITPEQIKLARALILFDNNSFDLAHTLLRELYDARSPFPQVYTALAEIYRLFGLPRQAARVLENRPKRAAEKTAMTPPRRMPVPPPALHESAGIGAA